VYIVYIVHRADGSVSDDVVDDAVSASGVASRSDKPPAAVTPPRVLPGAGGCVLRTAEYFWELIARDVYARWRRSHACVRVRRQNGR
jgi:hypothetical protein